MLVQQEKHTIEGESWVKLVKVTHVCPETRNQAGRQRARREGKIQGVQPSDEGSRGHLPSLGHATGTVYQSENL